MAAARGGQSDSSPDPHHVVYYQVFSLVEDLPEQCPGRDRTFGLRFRKLRTLPVCWAPGYVALTRSAFVAT